MCSCWNSLGVTAFHCQSKTYLVGVLEHECYFPFHLWDNHSHWLIFLKMVKTTNQILSLVDVGISVATCKLLYGYVSPVPLLDYLCTNAQINIGQRWPESLWPCFLGLDPYYSSREAWPRCWTIVTSFPSIDKWRGSGVPGFLKNGVTHGDPKIHGKTLVMFHGEAHIGFGVPILRNHQIEGSKINLWQNFLDTDKPNYAHLHEICFTPLKTKTCYCPIRTTCLKANVHVSQTVVPVLA